MLVAFQFLAVLCCILFPGATVVMRTNNQLLAPGRDLLSAETRSLLEKWGVCMPRGACLVFWPLSVYLVSLFGG